MVGSKAAFILLASMMPVPERVMLPPVPSTSPAVFVPAVTALKAAPPPEPFAAAVIDPSAATVIFALV